MLIDEDKIARHNLLMEYHPTDKTDEELLQTTILGLSMQELSVLEMVRLIEFYRCHTPNFYMIMD